MGGIFLKENEPKMFCKIVDCLNFKCELVDPIKYSVKKYCLKNISGSFPRKNPQKCVQYFITSLEYFLSSYNHEESQ